MAAVRCCRSLVPEEWRRWRPRGPVTPDACAASGAPPRDAECGGTHRGAAHRRCGVISTADGPEQASQSRLPTVLPLPRRTRFAPTTSLGRRQWDDQEATHLVTWGMCCYSIVVPTYNRVSMLQQTVASAPRRIMHDFEVVVVDDASEDDTWDYLHRLSWGTRGYPQPERGCTGREFGIGAISLSRGQYVLHPPGR